MRVVTLCCFLGALPHLTAQAVPGPAPSRPPADPPEQAEVFALLDALGFLDVPQAPFVSVHLPPVGDREQPPLHGMLLDSQRDRFTVLLLDVGRTTFAIDAGAPAAQRVSFQAEDLRDYVRDLGTEPKRRAGMEWEPFDDATRAVLLARTCSRRGFANEAKALWNSLPAGYRSRKALLENIRFCFDVQDRLILDIADPSLSWQQLLQRHDAVLELVPQRHRDWFEFTQSRRDLIASTVDRARAAAPDGDAPEAVRLANALCDQFVPASYWFDSLPLPPRAPPSSYVLQPADRLVALGLTAVPPLIEVLQDQRPTRTVYFTPRRGGGFFFATVGDVARECLTRIAGGMPRSAATAEDWKRWYDVARAQGLAAAHEMLEMKGSTEGYNWLLDAQRASAGWQR